MTGVLLLALFSEVMNWSLCKYAEANAWLHTEIAFDRTAAGLRLQPPNLGFLAVVGLICLDVLHWVTDRIPE